MKITDIHVDMLQVKQCPAGDSIVVHIETDEGISGIGESCTHSPASAQVGEASIGVKAIMERMYKRILVNEDPLDIRRLWDKMYSINAWYGRRGLAVFAISGIDVALMDIIGKALKVPVHKLLGGLYRKKIRVYASGLFNMEKPEETAKEAEKYVREGFTAMKFGWGQPPYTLTFGMAPQRDIEIIRLIRETVGYDIDIMVDVGRQPRVPWSWKHAARMIKKLEKYEIYWFEEPVPQDDINGYARLTQAVDAFIATGETEYTCHGFRDIISRGAVDVVQPDITKVGGLSEAKRIAEMAQTFGVLCVPHAWSTAINLVTGLHLVASMQNGFLLEYRTTPIGESGHSLMTNLVKSSLEPKKGYLEVPNKPGLGIELNKETLSKYKWG